MTNLPQYDITSRVRLVCRGIIERFTGSPPCRIICELSRPKALHFITCRMISLECYYGPSVIAATSAGLAQKSAAWTNLRARALKCGLKMMGVTLGDEMEKLIFFAINFDIKINSKKLFNNVVPLQCMTLNIVIII